MMKSDLSPKGVYADLIAYMNGMKIDKAQNIAKMMNVTKWTPKLIDQARKEFPLMRFDELEGGEVQTTPIRTSYDKYGFTDMEIDDLLANVAMIKDTHDGLCPLVSSPGLASGLCRVVYGVSNMFHKVHQRCPKRRKGHNSS